MSYLRFFFAEKQLRDVSFEVENIKQFFTRRFLMSLRVIDPSSRPATSFNSSMTITTTPSVPQVKRQRVNASLSYEQLDNPLGAGRETMECRVAQLREWNAQLQEAACAEEQQKLLEKMQQLQIVENLNAFKGAQGVTGEDWKGLKKECKGILGQEKLPIEDFQECLANCKDRSLSSILAKRIEVCILIEQLMDALQQRDLGAIKDVIAQFPISVLSQMLEGLQGSQTRSASSHHRPIIPRVYFCQLNEVEERMHFLQTVRARLRAAWGENLMTHPEWRSNLSAVVQKKIKEDFGQLHAWNAQLQEMNCAEEQQKILRKMQQLVLVERLNCFKKTVGINWEEWRGYREESKSILKAAVVRVEEHQTQARLLQTYSQKDLCKSLEILEKRRENESQIMNSAALPIALFERYLSRSEDNPFRSILIDRMRVRICIEQLLRFLPLQNGDLISNVIDHFPENSLLPLLEDIQKIQTFPIATDHRLSVKAYFCARGPLEEEIPLKRMHFLQRFCSQLHWAWGVSFLEQPEWELNTHLQRS